jgi:hypothetical protein
MLKTKGRPYIEKWLVYVHLHPIYDVMDEETYYKLFDTEKDAENWYVEQLSVPRMKEVEKPRIYKIIQLEPDDKGGKCVAREEI